MSGLREYLLRLCVGGICCAVALTLCGGGAKREITRFSCTCIMILLCFSGFGRLDFSDLNFSDGFTLQETVDDALEDQMQLKQAEVDLALAAYISDYAKSINLLCKVRVESYIEAGEYCIDRMFVGTSGGTANTELQDWLVKTFAIKETQIRWEDAG
jgi:hypothetical protein